MTRKVLVIGAQGVLGSFIAKRLAEVGWEVTRAGRRPEKAQGLRHVDLANPDTVSQACSDVDMVISTAHHPDLTLERTILRHGGTLIDLIEVSESEQARLETETANPEGLVVIHSGLGGVAYLAISDMLRENPTANAAEYALMVSAVGSSGRAGGLFAHKLLTGSSHHASVAVPFPFGTRRCLEVGDDAEGVARVAVGRAAVRHFLCMQPRALNGLVRAVNAARIISALPRVSFTAGRKRLPDELSEEPVCEWVAVSNNAARLASRTIEGCGYYRMTLAATVVFAEALLRNATRETGVRSVDEVLRLPQVVSDLEHEGIIVRKHDPEGSRA